MASPWTVSLTRALEIPALRAASISASREGASKTWKQVSSSATRSVRTYLSKELEWWERFRVELNAFPPPAADAPVLELFEPLGVTQPESPFVDLEPQLATILTEGQKAGAAKIEDLRKSSFHPTSEGWQSAMHAFDYNLDCFELGTIDTAEWKIADRKKAYVVRALAPRLGMWGNHGYEANYAFTFVDASGNQLDGTKRYELRLETEPPVNAFWSVSIRTSTSSPTRSSATRLATARQG